MNPMEQNLRILIVDDEPSLREVLRQVLIEDGYEVTEAANGEEALELFKQDPFPLVISDYVMPGMSGLELLKGINRCHPETEVIIMTSHAALESAVEATRLGAFDYLIKHFEDFEMISAVVKRAADKIRLADENRRLIERLRRRNEELLEANKAHRELTAQDEITGLFNCRYFQEALATELNRAASHARTFSLILLSIDHLKEYIDAYGQPAGDRILQTVAGHLKERLRRSDLAARCHDDQFAILLPETPKDGAACLTESMKQRMEQSLAEAGPRTSQAGVSIRMAVATFPEDGTDGSALMKRANQALGGAVERKQESLQ